MNTVPLSGVSLALAAALHAGASADVDVFFAKADWLAAVGQVTTIDFTGIPEYDFVTDQYVELGATFIGGNDMVLICPSNWPNDGAGCRSAPTPIIVEFATPQSWVAAETPGGFRLRLFLQGEQIFQSPWVFDFFGVLSGELFDEVHLVPITDPPVVTIDDLYFGPRMPGDANGDTVVNVADLLAVIFGWGECPAEGPCPADVTEDGHVNVADLLEVVLSWQ